jgi:nickel-dependent lactate racemase
MTHILRYGTDASVRLEPSDAVLLGSFGTPPVPPLDDPRAAVEQALAEPLDYPPLAKITTPGDRVVLAVAPGVPQAPEVVAGVIRCMVDAGVEPDGVTVLQTVSGRERDGNKRDGDDPRRLLPRTLRQRITRLLHDPADRSELAYLAATDSGEPIVLNRALIDADMVLPIGCFRDAATASYFGIHGPLYPTFSDRKTLDRFHSPKATDSHGRPKKRLVKEADEVGWLLGVSFTIQVIPGPGDRILHVLAGQSGSVRRRGRRLYAAAWNHSLPRRARLVLAAIEGGPAEQTWENLGRALAAAAGLVEPGGAVAVCSELADRPAAAVRQLAAARSPGEAIDAIRQQRCEDALPATQLAQVLDRFSVYLMSRLDESVVEDLGMTPVAGTDELARLARRYESYVLLANAPHVSVSVDGE